MTNYWPWGVCIVNCGTSREGWTLLRQRVVLQAGCGCVADECYILSKMCDLINQGNFIRITCISRRKDEMKKNFKNMKEI